MENGTRKEQSITVNDSNVLLSGSENIITVNVAESVKTEDEIAFIKQVIAEENKPHDPALILPTALEMNAKGTYSTALPCAKPAHKCRKGNCDKFFNTLTERALHETHEHKNAPRLIKCSFCSENFENFFALTRHMSEHRHVQSYVCSHCSKNFNSSQDLQVHRKTSVNCKDNEKELKKSKKQNRIFEATNDKELVRDHHQWVRQNNTNNLLSNFSADFANVNTNSTKPLTFAEEVKAFAAKYQLKTVARKRTSAFIMKPVQKGKKRKRMDFELEQKYAVPTAANNFVYPFQNLKIKQEPIDYDEMAAENGLYTDFAEQIQIKNEPHDEYENSIQENLFLNEEIAAKTTLKQYNCDLPFKNEFKAKQFIENPLSILTETTDLKQKNLIKTIPTQINVKNENDIQQTMRTLETIIKAGQQQEQPHQKIMLSKANLLAMKNVKILKLGPSAKIVKLSPTTSPLGSPEENKSNLTSLVLNNISSKQVALDTDSTTNILTADKIKVEQKTENVDSPFSMNLYTNNGDEDNVILNAVEDIIQNQPIKRRLPKWLIQFMEEQPQKRKIIDDLQRQFQNATEAMQSKAPAEVENAVVPLPAEKPVRNDEAEEEQETLNVVDDTPKQPESFFLKVTDSSDKALMIARRQFNDHYYAWICPMCCKEYTQKHTFISHLIGTHKICNENLKNLTVEVKPFLLQTVKPEQNLSSTQTREDDEMLTHRFECLKCKRIYITKQAIIDHQNSDCGRLPLYVCTVCAKPFASHSTLKCHMSIHTGELKYQCKYCDKRFRTNGQVRVHQRKHTGEKPFKCQICALAFRHRETLISHLSRHMDIKRYICRGCDKRFSTISALTTHRNVRPKTCGSLELDTQAVGPLIRVTQGQIKFEPQRDNNCRVRRKICEQILNEIQNIPKIKKEPEQQLEESSQSSSFVSNE